MRSVDFNFTYMFYSPFVVMLIEIVSHADHFNFQAVEPLNHALNDNTKNTDTDSSGGNRYAPIFN